MIIVFYPFPQDYIVFLPEDYYKAELLKDVSSEPCLLRTSKPEHCDMYTYYEPKSPSIITVSGDKAYTLPLKGNPDIFIDPRFDLRDQRLSNMALLGNIQVILHSGFTVLEVRCNKARNAYMCLLVCCKGWEEIDVIEYTMHKYV